MPYAVLLALLSAQAPPARVTPVPPSIAADFQLDPFYAQCLLEGPLPIVASPSVSEFALLEAAYLIRGMVGARPELLDALAANKVRFVVMAVDEWTTDVPEHADLEPAAYWDVRARGLGATRWRPAVSCGEENLLQLEGDRYGAENILIHEFAHALHEMALSTLDPSFDARLAEAFEAARANGLWDGTYADTNRHEYWAEGAQSWFDTNRQDDAQHGPIDTRAELRAHDPRLAALCAEVFGEAAPAYVPPLERAAPGHLAGFERARAPRFAWPEEMRKAYEAALRERERAGRGE